MTLSELRAVLNALDEKHDNVEICISNHGLVHVDALALDIRKPRKNPHWPEIPSDRYTRKLVILARHHALWFSPPPFWQLEGPFPSMLADFNIDHPQELV